MSVNGIYCKHNFLSKVESDKGEGRSDRRSELRERRETFNEMIDSMRSGDLEEAREAYSTLKQEVLDIIAAENGHEKQITRLGNDFISLTENLQSGDIRDAKKDFSALQRDIKILKHHEHHYGGHHCSRHRIAKVEEHESSNNSDADAGKTEEGNEVSACATSPSADSGRTSPVASPAPASHESVDPAGGTPVTQPSASAADTTAQDLSAGTATYVARSSFSRIQQGTRTLVGLLGGSRNY